MLRAELDALPVPEKTGLPMPATSPTHDDRGVEVPVMHACGHDLHMAVGSEPRRCSSRIKIVGTVPLSMSASPPKSVSVAPLR